MFQTQRVKRRVALLYVAFAIVLVAVRGDGRTADASTGQPAAPAFEAVWSRTDKPVADQFANRSWVEGPQANSPAFMEPYAESPGGARLVQYYDKGRLEITDPGADAASTWFVTSGLLVNEMVSGDVQRGDNQYEPRAPASITIAGDPGDPGSPTYASIAALLASPAVPDGAPLIKRWSPDGSTWDDPSLSRFGVTAAYRAQAPAIDHQVARPFWDYMNSSGLVYTNGLFVTDRLFQNPFYLTGLPITEAYWIDVRLNGNVRSVLLQCFERRCLTFTPDNPLGWQVESANVGRHYQEWRYGTVNGGLGPPVIAAAGDIACSPRQATFNGGAGVPGRCQMAATSDLIANGDFNAVLTLGDEQYNSGRLADYQNSYDRSWGRFKDITYPVPGNHEYGTPGAAGYFSYFGSRAGDPARGYYSYDIGAWHIIALNSNCDAVGGCGVGSPQYQWLAADLQARRGGCSLVYFHEPRWSSGTHGNNTALAPFWELLYDNQVDLVLNGHDHDYERFAPMGKDGAIDTARGVREFVVGTGGSQHYRFHKVPPASEARNADSFGVLQLTLFQDAYSWRFIPEAGSSFTDAGTSQCHAPSTAPERVPSRFSARQMSLPEFAEGTSPRPALPNEGALEDWPLPRLDVRQATGSQWRTAETQRGSAAAANRRAMPVDRHPAPRGIIGRGDRA